MASGTSQCRKQILATTSLLQVNDQTLLLQWNHRQRLMEKRCRRYLLFRQAWSFVRDLQLKRPIGVEIADQYRVIARLQVNGPSLLGGRVMAIVLHDQLIIHKNAR